MQPIFDDKFIAALTPIVISILGGAARCALDARRVTVTNLARGITLAAFAGYVVHLSLVGLGFSDGTRGALTGIASFAADDFLLGVLVIGQKFSKDPLGTISTVRSTIRSEAKPEIETVNKETPKT